MFQNWIDMDGGNIGQVQLFCAFTSFSHCLLWADIILYLRINYLNLLFKYSYKPLSSVTFIYHTRLVRRLLLNETSSMKKKSFKHKLSFLRYTSFCLNILHFSTNRVLKYPLSGKLFTNRSPMDGIMTIWNFESSLDEDRKGKSVHTKRLRMNKLEGLGCKLSLNKHKGRQENMLNICQLQRYIWS